MNLVTWIGPHRPKTPSGKCNHLCFHNQLSIVALGPTIATYEVVECMRCSCRAWRAYDGSFLNGFWSSL
jgi:hypothetical protein